MTTYKINWKKEPLILIVLIVPIIALLLLWNQLPDQLAAHWGLNGEVDGYVGKWLFPVINFSMYFLLLLLPFLDPRKKNYALFNNTYWKIRLFFAFFLSVILGIAVLMGLGYDFGFNKMVPILICILFIFLGNLMGTIRPNWFLGIRTPWTLDNEEVWKRTHRLAGKLWVGAGVLGLLIALLLPISVSNPIVFGLVGLAAIIPTAYSFFLYKKIQKVS